MQRLRTRLRAGASTFPAATFALNFLTGGLDPRVTFSRATTATFVGSNGLIQTAAINGPRFDYDPVTLAAKGLLIEEQRTNLVLQSQFVSGWSTNGGTTTFNATDVTSPDGTTNGRTVNDTSAAAAAYVYQAVSFTSGTVYSMSVYVKKGVSTFFQLQSFTQAGLARFNLATNTLVAISGIVTSATITNAGNGWYRCTATMTASATASNNIGYGDFEAGPTGDLFSVYGAQLEAGAFATSYIPTVASTVTRSADVATMTGTNFSSWYNQSEGTIVASVDTVAPTGSTILSFQDGAGASTNRQQMNVYTTCTATVVGGAVQSNMGINTSAAVNLAYAYKANDFAASANGGTVATDTSGTVPTTLAYATLGKWDFGSAASLNGHIRQIAYYNTRLPNATLQALTA